jgi:hypothetical protein
MYTHVFGNVTTDSSLVHIHRDSRSFSGHPYFRIEALTSQLLSALIRGISWGTFFLVWHPEISIEFDGFEISTGIDRWFSP